MYRALSSRWEYFRGRYLTQPLVLDIPGKQRTIFNSVFYRWLRVPSIASCFIFGPATLIAFGVWFAPPLFSPEVLSAPDAAGRAQKFIEARDRLVRERVDRINAANKAKQSSRASDSDEPEQWIPFVPEPEAPRQVSRFTEMHPWTQDPFLRAALMFGAVVPFLGLWLAFNARNIRRIDVLPNRLVRLTFVNNFFRSKKIEVPIDLIMPPYTVQGTRDMFVHRLHLIEPSGEGTRIYFIMAPANDKRLSTANRNLFESLMTDNRFKDSEIKVDKY